jgi:hypothetical protein
LYLRSLLVAVLTLGIVADHAGSVVAAIWDRGRASFVPASQARGLSLRDYRCGVSSNPRAIPHRHLKETHAYGRHRQTEHQHLGAEPKLAELVKVVFLVDPEIEIVGNHGEPKRRVQNAGNTPPSHGRHVE